MALAPGQIVTICMHVSFYESEEPMLDYDASRLHVVDHPLVQHKLSISVTRTPPPRTFASW